jgi:DNA-binding GntR family transcriptional regulator
MHDRLLNEICDKSGGYGMANGFEAEEGADDRGLLSDRIRNALADEIASGTLAAGAALDEQQLADRFGASRTPVREALRQLAANGLVEVRARRGVVVARMTPERIMDMFETSAEIEALCVRLATYRMTPIERSQLIELHDMSRLMVEREDFDAYDAFNLAFHQGIHRASHNGFLAEQALAVSNRLSAFRRKQLRQSERLRRSRDEHDAIMQAIAEGDGEMAARRMRAHMLNAATALRRFIEASKVV